MLRDGIHGQFPNALVLAEIGAWSGVPPAPVLQAAGEYVDLFKDGKAISLLIETGWILFQTTMATNLSWPAFILRQPDSHRKQRKSPPREPFGHGREGASLIPAKKGLLP